MKEKRKQPILISMVIATLVAVVASTWLVVPGKVQAARSIVFPVIGSVKYSNDYNSPRSNGIHAATDIMGHKMQPLVAAVSGTVTFVGYPQPSWGYSVFIRDSEGYTYRYLHINNDTSGTDDGNGGAMNAYAPDMVVGKPVVRGQLIGYMGDSGNAETTPPHVHFEIFAPDGSPTNPYDSLIHAQRISEPSWYPQLPGEVLPYNVGYRGAIHVAMGNFDGDSASETVTAPTAPGGPHIRLIDNNDVMMPGKEFFAYDAGFAGGVDVAAGDVDGDGVDEIITAPGPGGGPHIRIFKTNGVEVGGFYAYEAGFAGGVRVSAGDLDGDGEDEIITAPASRGGPHVRAFKPNGTEVLGFYAYHPGFTGGVDVAGGDVSGDSKAEIVTSPNMGGGPHVRIFRADGSVAGDFGAYDPGYTGGVRVSVGNVRTSTSKSEIVTAPASHGGPNLRMFNGSGTLIDQSMFMEVWWAGFYDVAAGYDASRASAGHNRRGTVRKGLLD